MTTQAIETPDLVALRDAVVDALTEAGATPMTLQQVRDAPTLPSYYTEVTVSLRYTATARLSGQQGMCGYRIGTRAVAEIEVTALVEQQVADKAMRGARLIVAGVTSTGVRFETADEVATDEGKWSGLTTWTTTIKNRRAS